MPGPKCIRAWADPADKFPISVLVCSPPSHDGGGDDLYISFTLSFFRSLQSLPSMTPTPQKFWNMSTRMTLSGLPRSTAC